MDETKTKIKAIAIIFFCCYALVSCFTNTVKAEDNDTAFSANILPNADTTTSNYSNANFDGVASSTGSLTNNSTHNGFTITCETQVSNACGRSNTSVGELEASHDMTVTATGSLVGIEGDSTPDGVTHTSTQLKLNGGINLSSSIAVQNCEWSGSAYRCGSSAGVVDSYTLTMKVKNEDGDVLASSTQIRTNDSGYNANEIKFYDSLHYNGVHANSYEWSWTGVDGSESTSAALRGPNLLGAEMALDFPTDDYEPLSTEEIKSINESLGTTNLTESEIWNVVSGLEESIGEKLNLETGGSVVSVELNEETMSVTVYTAKEASVKEVAKVQEVVQTMNETKAVETLKQEVIKEVIQESKKAEIINEKKEEQKETKSEIKTEEKQKEKKQEEPKKVANAKEEPTQEKKSSSTTTTTKVVSTKSNTKQKKLQSKKVKADINKIMDKIDEQVKDVAKNLQIKNIIKLEAMASDQESLDLYVNIKFYIPKDIYLNQLDIFDSRDIYNNINLASYTNNDTIAIKANKLYDIKLKKQKLLMEIRELKNG